MKARLCFWCIPPNFELLNGWLELTTVDEYYGKTIALADSWAGVLDEESSYVSFNLLSVVLEWRASLNFPLWATSRCTSSTIWLILPISLSKSSPSYSALNDILGLDEFTRLPFQLTTYATPNFLFTVSDYFLKFTVRCCVRFKVTSLAWTLRLSFTVMLESWAYCKYITVDDTIYFDIISL